MIWLFVLYTYLTLLDMCHLLSIANHMIGGGGGGGDAEEEKEAEEEVEEAPPAVDVSSRMRDHEHIMYSFCLYLSYMLTHPICISFSIHVFSI